MPDFQRITPRFAVAPQIDPGDIAHLDAEGITHVVCNRPDGEEPGQPTIHDIEAACKAAGIGFSALPVAGGEIGPAHIDGVGALISAGTPTLAYCRSGRRSAVVHALARVQLGDPVDQVIGDALVAGHDLGPMAPMLAAQARPAGK